MKKKFGMPKGPPKQYADTEGRKRHVGSSTQAARLGSYAHKAAHAAGKAKRFK